MGSSTEIGAVFKIKDSDIYNLWASRCLQYRWYSDGCVLFQIRHPVLSLMDKSFSRLEHIKESNIGLLGFLGPFDDFFIEIVWGIGIMVGPILGPTLGGYITEMADWRWIFYINVPFCLLSLIMAINILKETKIEKNIHIDWTSLISMSLGVGALQVFLDRGN